LVLHRRDDKAVRISAGRDVASRIAGAQFVELDGNDHWFFAGEAASAGGDQAVYGWFAAAYLVGRLFLLSQTAAVLEAQESSI
jgi:hypothetical protein